MIESAEPSRDLSALVVPRHGALRESGDPFEPYRLLDASGEVVAPAAAYLRDLQARGLPETIGSQGRGARTGPFPHPPFNPYVRFSRIRLTDDLLGMVTPPSDSGRCHAGGTGPAR